ncbi:MAG: hypothetical protein ABI461_15010 [Polyangiaceae bacterium]
MSNPFRQPGETPTAAALARFETMPTHPIRRLATLFANYREIAVANTPTTLTASAREAKMRYLGAASEGLFGRLSKQIFVDDVGTTQAHLSAMGYFFATYFESGKCILTFGHNAVTPSSEILRVRSGSSAFLHDYRGHCTAVADWIDAGESAITVPDVSTAVTLGCFYYSHVLPMRTAALMVLMNPAVLGAIFILTCALLYFG